VLRKHPRAVTVEWDGKQQRRERGQNASDTAGHATTGRRDPSVPVALWTTEENQSKNNHQKRAGSDTYNLGGRHSCGGARRRDKTTTSTPASVTGEAGAKRRHATGTVDDQTAPSSARTAGKPRNEKSSKGVVRLRYGSSDEGARASQHVGGGVGMGTSKPAAARAISNVTHSCLKTGAPVEEFAGSIP